MPVGEARMGEGRVPTLRELVVEWVVMLAVGVALAALGPFGSFELGGFGHRLAYWVPAAFLGYAIFRPITLGAILTARRLALPELPAALLGTIVAAAPGALAIAYLGGYRPGAEPGFEELFQLYVQVAVVGVLVMLVFVLIENRTTRPDPLPTASRQRQSEPDIAPSGKIAPFFERLPPGWVERLVALEMEDHYVRAHAASESRLILLRMRDAEAELNEVEGLRVHRSWWVARRAVEEVVRDGRSYRLRLQGGLEAPVARERIAALKEAGWL
ncbi:MAG TPA: LytTR family DNA-binding domain-containing protein [Sphingomicrobium sp.]|nr:LytTR family DNA-binding domain-containing protein [Sphingomicrobium sp.]